VVKTNTTAALQDARGSEPNSAPHPMAWRAAAANCALLITGATGTGKGHLARWIHQQSARATGPFVPVNCGAIPESLIDSHLFGHAKGAFSGASADHLGLVRAASCGTLLLDEIGELPMSAQLRLLRLLEEREVQPIGHSKPLLVDVRIITATNGDLMEFVRNGRFREDLYFRLDVVRLHVRPLRERGEEIPRLLEQFNAEFAELYRQAQLVFEPEASDLLAHYAWPGNVRELRTVVERLHVLLGVDAGPVSEDDLYRFGQLRRSAPNSTGSGIARLAAIKVEAVEHALSACRGNVSRAASTLGVHRSTIYRWLAERSVPA
jgi:transcriptional regulator with PAS, ATPase and Fis domain